MIDKEYYKGREKKVLSNIITKPDYIKDFIGQLYQINQALGSFAIEEKDFSLAKKYYYTCGKIDAYRVLKFNERLFDYAIPNVCNSVLSDCKELIAQYANLRYLKIPPLANLSMEEMVSDGEITIFCHSIQMIMKQDWKTLERNLNIIETITLPKKTQNPELLRLDFEIYKAIYRKDKVKCEEILEQLVSPKIHQKRNDDQLLSKSISQPALGYAKLAWINGLEVNINSPLIPKSLLPIMPNENYENIYDFLKA